MPVWSAGQPAGWREVGVASHHKTIFSSTAVFSCLKKKCYSRYTLLNVLIMSSDFSFRFYSTWWCTRAMKHFILSLEIKFLSVVILYHHVVLHQQIPTFTITEIFFKDIKSPTCKCKTITFHLEQSYCLNIIYLWSNSYTSHTHKKNKIKRFFL